MLYINDFFFYYSVREIWYSSEISLKSGSNDGARNSKNIYHQHETQAPGGIRIIPEIRVKSFYNLLFIIADAVYLAEGVNAWNRHKKITP